MILDDSQCFLIYFLSSIRLGLISYLILHHRNRFQFFKLPHSQVLLLTAHPDDEVMFFAPTVLSLVEQGM